MPENSLPEDPTPLRFSLAEEEAEARITERLQGIVRITKRVEMHPVHAPIEIRTEHVTVRRIRRNEVVAAAREPWQEEDTLIIPVYEERLVTATELVLVEEVHVRTRSDSTRVELKEAIRREVVDIERLPSE